MRRLVPLVIRPWMLPLIVAALAVPIIAGFALAGPPLGLGLGAIAVAVLLITAATARYDEPIETLPAPDSRYRILVVADGPVDDPDLVDRISAIAEEGRAVLDREQAPQVLVLAPARTSLLDRWASDLGEAREAAARALAVSLAALAAGGIDASGRVGDPDPVQAIRDELLSFPAREVVLVAGPGLGSREAEEVGRRLDRPVRLIDQPKRPTSSA
jgi:hypothetical protein